MCDQAGLHAVVAAVASLTEDPYPAEGFHRGDWHRLQVTAPWVLLAIFCSLRWGELAALRRCDIDLEAGTVRVVRQVTTLSSGRQVIGPPKSEAGKRVVIVPEVIVPRCSCTCAGWPGRARMGCCSPARKASRCDMTISATASGTRRSRPPGCLGSTSTT